MIRREFADWNKQSEHVYQYMCHLDEVGQSQEQIKQMVG
jgi:hypothetical protein